MDGTGRGSLRRSGRSLFDTPKAIGMLSCLSLMRVLPFFFGFPQLDKSLYPSLLQGKSGSKVRQEKV